MFDLNYFQKLPNKNAFLAGVDEVGRGPLAGPVVSTCVLIHQKEKDENEFSNLLETLNSFGVTDSKKLNDNKRKLIIDSFSFPLISNQINVVQITKNLALSYFIQEISVDEIDKINILNAALKSMKIASEALIADKCGIVLIDGNKKFKSELNIDLESIVKGDSKSLLIGLASVIAKVYRDQLMIGLSKKYPMYLWDKNAGYGTKMHLDAIAEFGITDHHRKTFRGVKEHVFERENI